MLMPPASPQKQKCLSCLLMPMQFIRGCRHRRREAGGAAKKLHHVVHVCGLLLLSHACLVPICLVLKIAPVSQTGRSKMNDVELALVHVLFFSSSCLFLKLSFLERYREFMLRRSVITQEGGGGVVVGGWQGAGRENETEMGIGKARQKRGRRMSPAPAMPCSAGRHAVQKAAGETQPWWW